VRKPPPWLTVTDSIPATLPAKVITPASAAWTGVSGSALKSIPQ